ENTSHEMNNVSATISHEKARPTKVLTLSMRSSSFCINKSHPAGAGWLCAKWRRSGFLRGGLRGALAEVVVIGHLAAYVSVEIPLHHALGESLLRRDDLDEQGIVLALVDRRVVGVELAAQDGVGRLVKAHLVLGLHLAR